MSSSIELSTTIQKNFAFLASRLEIAAKARLTPRRARPEIDMRKHRDADKTWL
jgi:hypothetical protein